MLLAWPTPWKSVLALLGNCGGLKRVSDGHPVDLRTGQIFTRYVTTLNPKAGLDYRGRVPDASP